MPTCYRHKFFRSLIILLPMSGILASAVLAQPLPAALAGGINLSTELYSSNGIAARRPGNMSQMFFTPILSLGEQIHIPIRFSLSTQQFSYRQPFNQIGLSPNFWGWLTVHAGYFSTQISDLTFGDTQLLGGGVELRPGAFRFSFLYGRSQEALQTDSINGVRGEYRRTIVAGKIGYGQDDAFFIDFNFLRAVDDSTSLTNPPVDVAPKENVVTSLAFGLPLFEDILRLQGEVAVSATSDD